MRRASPAGTASAPLRRASPTDVAAGSTPTSSQRRARRSGTTGFAPSPAALSRRRPVRTLFLGIAVSRLGESMTVVGLIWIVFEQTRSAEGVALVQFAYTVLIPVGGLFVGVVESLGGLLLGESLGQLGIFLLFILVLLVRPTGLFGAKA